jgi:hypothetical protein
VPITRRRTAPAPSSTRHFAAIHGCDFGLVDIEEFHRQAAFREDQPEWQPNMSASTNNHDVLKSSIHFILHLLAEDYENCR